MTINASDYSALSALMGRTIEIDGFGACRMSGCGMSGDHLNATLRSETGIDLFWSNTHGIETKANQKARMWNARHAALAQAERDLIDLVLGEELNALPAERRADPAKLVGVAKRRLVKSGAIEADTCSRCGGSGRYSYCEMYKDICFKCHGEGKTLPATGRALKAAKAVAR